MGPRRPAGRLHRRGRGRRARLPGSRRRRLRRGGAARLRAGAGAPPAHLLAARAPHRGHDTGPSCAARRARRPGRRRCAHQPGQGEGRPGRRGGRHARPRGHATAAADLRRLAQADRLRAAGRRRPGAQGAVLGGRRRDRRVRALLVVGERAGELPAHRGREPARSARWDATRPRRSCAWRSCSRGACGAACRRPTWPRTPTRSPPSTSSPWTTSCPASASGASACCRPPCRWRRSPPRSRPCCASRRCATPATAPAWCGASPCCPARAARPSPPVWARSPTCS